MTTKEAIFKSSMIVLFAAGVGATSIVNYDTPNFYQDDLDAAHARAFRADQNIACEYDAIYQIASQEVKSYPEYKKMDSLIQIHKQNPETYYYLEKQIDSLEHKVDSIQEEIATERINNSTRIDEAYERLNQAYRDVDRLTQDSIINDSITNQPVIQRFKNNWNKIFCQHKQH